MTRPPVPKRLYSVKDTSTYLSLGVHGVRSLIWTGQVPVVKIGRKQFIAIEDLETFVTNNKWMINEK